MITLKEIGRRWGNAWRAIKNRVTGSYELLVDHSRRNDSGIRVTNRRILEYAPIYFSVCKMGGHIGTMPRRVKIVVGDSVTPVTPQMSGLPELLNLIPNDFTSAMDLFETIQKDAVIDGNVRIGIIRKDGTPTALIGLHPDSVFTFISYPDRGAGTVSDRAAFGPVFGAVTKWHHVTAASGGTFILPDSDCIHIKGLQHDGLTGMALWDVARNSIGGGLAAEKHVNRTMVNNGVPGLILEAPEGVLTDKDKAEEFLDSFIRMHEGLDNPSRTGLLRYGVTARQLSQTGRANQLIENRKFSRDEAWLWTGDMVFVDGGSAYSNQQERDNAYKQHTLGRWVSKWEDELNIKLLTSEQRRRGWVIDFDQNAILRGSLKQRLEEYEIARRIGYLSQEETRRLDGLPAPNETDNFTNPNTATAATNSELAPVEPSQEAAQIIASRIVELTHPLPPPALPPPDRDPTVDSSRGRARARLAAFLKKERKSACHFANDPRTFANKMELFYKDHAWAVDRITHELGVKNWVDDSRVLLLEACECQPNELAQRIYDETKTWPTKRAASILEDSILCTQ